MRIFKYLWLILVAGVLVINILDYTSNPQGDATGNIMFILGILGLPFSIVPTVAILLMVGNLLPEASNPYVFGGICLSYFIVGAFQWLWLFPKVFKYFGSISPNKSAIYRLRRGR